MANVIEQTLAVVMRCFVYRIPPAKTVAGHEAREWFVLTFSGHKVSIAADFEQG